MATKTDIVKNLRTNSPFNKNSYEVNVPLKNFIANIHSYNTNGLEFDGDFIQSVSDATPVFQRDSDKWSLEMQIKFIENILLGYTSVIMLGCVCPDETDKGSFANSQLIDGLQRTTAIAKFLNEEFSVFNNKVEGGLLSSELDRTLNIHNLKLRIYEFDSEKEMVQFYIDMNENITHSSADIQRAKQYLESL